MGSAIICAALLFVSKCAIVFLHTRRKELAVRKKYYKLARQLETVVINKAAKAGDNVLLTLRIQGDQDHQVYVKGWDGKNVHIWGGIEWRVVGVIKTDAYENTYTPPLWWSTFNWRE